MKLSIIFPARNEEQTIAEALEETAKYLKKKNYTSEILVVVNGSTDKTEEIVLEKNKKYRNIKLTKSKQGYGFALKKGLSESKGDFIIIYNVDFYDLRLIDLVDIDLYGKDLIIGSKMAHWSKDDRPIQRKIVSTLFNLYLKLIFNFKGSDTHGIKALKKEVVEKILSKCKTTSGIFDTEMVLRIQKANFNIADFPVEVWEKRPSRFSKRLFQTPKDIYELTKALKG